MNLNWFRRPRIAFAGATLLTLTLKATAQSSPPASVEFNRDIAPIIFEHCAVCHRPGGPAPFSLLGYDDVRSRARQVVAAVGSRVMPPWKPIGLLGEFEGDRRLTDAQVKTFQQWLSAGAPRGAAADLPPAPAMQNDWELGTPDLLVKLDAPYELAPGGSDQLRNFVVSLPVPATRYVRAWEFRTTNTRVVHHATLMLDRGGAARRLDAQTPESGYEGIIPFSATTPEGYFLGWTPGQRAYQSRPGIAWQIDPGSDLIVMLHMLPGEARERVDASVALYFGARQPSRVPVMIRLNRQDLDIPPGASHYVASDSYTLPVAVELHAAQPHAHYLARAITATARTPDGRTRTLLDIPDWDFHWQDVYRYSQPLTLPAGTQLTMGFTYDNSAGNRANPSAPPARVIWGQRSRDEMGDLWLQVVPTGETDYARLVADLRRKTLPQNIDGYRKMVERDPDNPALHDDLALLAIESGNPEIAAAEFLQSVRLRPEVAASHYNLGNALLALHRNDEAERRFREALRIDERYGLAYQGLGLALGQMGRVDDGASSLEEAVRLLPASSDARYNLGVLRQQQGRFDAALVSYESAAAIEPMQADARYAAALIREAQGEFVVAVSLLRQALDARPAWPRAQAELAWVLAASPDASLRRPPEALRLALEATAANPRDVRATDVLAAAQASAGAYGDAVSSAEHALRLLSAAAPSALGSALAARLELYRAGRAFVIPVSPAP